jgi:hypothetical protein
MQHGQTARKWSMSMDMQQGSRNMNMHHGQAAWTCTMDMQHKDMDMQKRHAAWTSSMICSIETWICNKDMQHGRAA